MLNDLNITPADIERSSDSEFEMDLAELAKFPFLKDIINGYPELVVILNSRLEIAASNKEGMHAFKQNLISEILGKRFGEAIGCINAESGQDGCGTSAVCPECGAFHAINSSLSSIQEGVKETDIKISDNEKEISLDFRIYTKRMMIGEREFLFLTAKDISDEKRRLALERIFFHDVLNTSGAIHGIATFLQESESEEDRNELMSALLEASTQLLDEIETQKDLRNAENGNLNVDKNSFDVNKVLFKVYDLYKNHDVAKGKNFKVEKLPKDVSIKTDLTLLTRSIGNLVKNALEAVQKNGNVILSAEDHGDFIVLNIHNDGVIPPNIQVHIFQRSFSTKGNSGRGIGTYSVKLLVENYLGGTVSFISNQEKNTVFSIKLPK
ncbi:MAG: ATP-binding protein [bacterium]